jgi:hypothetical protein
MSLGLSGELSDSFSNNFFIFGRASWTRGGGGVVEPSQGLYLHSTAQHRKTLTYLEWDSKPRSHCWSGQVPRLRPQGTRYINETGMLNVNRRSIYVRGNMNYAAEVYS